MASNSYKGGVKSMRRLQSKRLLWVTDFKHMAAHCTVLEASKNPRLFPPCYVLVKTRND